MINLAEIGIADVRELREKLTVLGLQSFDSRSRWMFDLDLPDRYSSFLCMFAPLVVVRATELRLSFLKIRRDCPWDWEVFEHTLDFGFTWLAMADSWRLVRRSLYAFEFNQRAGRAELSHTDRCRLAAMLQCVYMYAIRASIDSGVYNLRLESPNTDRLVDSPIWSKFC